MQKLPLVKERSDLHKLQKAPPSKGSCCDSAPNVKAPLCKGSSREAGEGLYKLDYRFEDHSK